MPRKRLTRRGAESRSRSPAEAEVAATVRRTLDAFVDDELSDGASDPLRDQRALVLSLFQGHFDRLTRTEPGVGSRLLGAYLRFCAEVLRGVGVKATVRAAGIAGTRLAAWLHTRRLVDLEEAADFDLRIGTAVRRLLDGLDEA